jgi:hypothetical protein
MANLCKRFFPVIQLVASIGSLCRMIAVLFQPTTLLKCDNWLHLVDFAQVDTASYF